MNTKSSDEIDLQEILISTVKFIQSKFRILLLSAVAGSILLGALSFFMPKSFVSKLILSSDILTESYSERITESLNNLIKESNYKVLSTRLSITEEQANKIEKIEIESAKKGSKTEKAEESIFIITVEVSDKSILPKLQEGILIYLRSNEFVKIRVQNRITFYSSMIEKIGFELKSLDSLKRRLFQGKAIYSSNTEMLLVDPANVYSKIIELSKIKVEYENNLNIVNSIQLVEGFTVYEKPVKPHRGVLIIVGFLSGLFVSLLIMGIKWTLNQVELSKA